MFCNVQNFWEVEFYNTLLETEEFTVATEVDFDNFDYLKDDTDDTDLII